MNTFEEMHRAKKHVCGGCGWGLVTMDDGDECVNPQCLRPTRPKRRREFWQIDF